MELRKNKNPWYLIDYKFVSVLSAHCFNFCLDIYFIKIGLHAGFSKPFFFKLKLGCGGIIDWLWNKQLFVSCLMGYSMHVMYRACFTACMGLLVFRAPFSLVWDFYIRVSAHSCAYERAGVSPDQLYSVDYLTPWLHRSEFVMLHVCTSSLTKASHFNIVSTSLILSLLLNHSSNVSCTISLTSFFDCLILFN